ncbi:hypothetical protein ACU4GD_23030 [Cupriavidus basilensis]
MRGIGGRGMAAGLIAMTLTLGACQTVPAARLNGTHSRRAAAAGFQT